MDSPPTSPTVAVIVAVPLPTAVTNPEASTVATEASLLDQVTVAPAIACPFWSRTSAESCRVAPTAANSAVAGLSVTVVARGGSTVGGAVGPSLSPPPHAEAAARPATTVHTRIVRLQLTGSPSGSVLPAVPVVCLPSPVVARSPLGLWRLACPTASSKSMRPGDFSEPHTCQTLCGTPGPALGVRPPRRSSRWHGVGGHGSPWGRAHGPGQGGEEEDPLQ